MATERRKITLSEVQRMSAKNNASSLEATLIPFSNDRANTSFITVDRQGRLCLSSKLRKDLGNIGNNVALYASYDKINKRIGLAKPDIVRLTNTRPFTFDKNRGYAMARNFLKAAAISYTQASRYIYDGVEGDGWLTFKLEGYAAPDKPIGNAQLDETIARLTNRQQT